MNLLHPTQYTFRIFFMAKSALWAYKLRSTFVIAAIALGIASLTVIIAALDGANRQADEITESFGPDAALILGRNVISRAVGQRTKTLTWEDLRAIRSSIPGVELAVPMRRVNSRTVVYKNNNITVGAVIATAADYGRSWNWPLAEGRDISEEDMKKGARVALLGDYVSQQLFASQSPVGKTIFVNKIPLLIVGKLTPRGFSGGGGGNLDDRIIIPMTTGEQRFGIGRNAFPVIRVKFTSANNMEAHVDNLTGLLRHKHDIRIGQNDDFSVLTADDVQKFLSILKGGLVIFLGVTAASAMLVGGFVLANLFYISVTERIHEIGVKKALGAPDSAILLQFIFEAVLLSLTGALVGIFLGLGMAQTLKHLGLIEIRLSWKIFTLSLLAATMVGIIFGLRPARNAAQKDPIRALQGDES